MLQVLALSDTAAVVITTVSTLFAQVGIGLTAWFKFKSVLATHSNQVRDEVRTSAQDIKHFTDSSVTKLNGMLRYVISSMDCPCWLKIAVHENDRLVFRMLEVNSAYEEMFGVSRLAYIGKTDAEVGWEAEDADEFYRQDVLVYSSGEPQNFVETYEGKDLKFRKVRVRTEDGVAKGILCYQVDVCPATFLEEPCPEC